MIVNTSVSSRKRVDNLQQKEHKRMVERLKNVEISTRKGKN